MSSIHTARNFAERHKEPLILAAFTVCFFILSSFLSWGMPARFVSPDETANYFFTKQFSQNFRLASPEPLESLADNLIHPRSVGVQNGNLVPGSFTGIIILYGVIAKIFGAWSITFLTSLLAGVAVFFFYLLLKEIFHRKIAMLSALLLVVHPAYWYYSARSMMHNVLFVALFILASYFLVKLIKTREKKYYSFLGVFLVLALMVRIFEIFWVAALLSFVILFVRGIRRPLALTLIIAIALTLLFHFSINQYLFHNALFGGYSPAQEDGVSLAGGAVSSAQRVVQVFLPFGVHGKNIIQNFNNYFLKIFPWFSLFTLLGVALSLKHLRHDLRHYKTLAEKKGEVIYFLLYIFVVLWLAVYYGSWNLKEYSDPNKIILGSSFVRYWLPIYIFGLPYCVFGIQATAQLFRGPSVRKFSEQLIIIAIVALSASLVVFDPLYGLQKVKSDIQEYQKMNETITNSIPHDSVIISGYADKVFFPQRRVIVQLPENDPQTTLVLRKLIKVAPLYFYKVSGSEIDELNERIIREAHMKLSDDTELRDGETLYRVLP